MRALRHPLLSRGAAVVVCGVVLAGCSSEPPTPKLRGPGSSAPEDGGASSGGGDDSGAATPADSGAGADAALGPEESGEATYYNAGGAGACGLPTPADFMVCAINDEQYSTENCGRCVSVKGPKGTVIVRIIDKCPGCGPGDLDLSETAFTKIADKSAGRVKITWHFVACP